MATKYFYFIIALFSLVSAQDVWNVVVMDLFGQYMTEKELHELTVTLEKELRKTGKFIVHDRRKIQGVLDEYGVTQKECRTVPWIVRIGKKLGMDKVVLGSVNKLGRTITVHVRTIDMEKKEIDRSATSVCKDCSVDVIFLRKLTMIARKLAGFEVSDTPNDSLFRFKSGPLVELEENKDDSEIQKKMKEKLFEDWRRPEIKRRYKIGMFLYTVGVSLIVINDAVWLFMDHPPETSKRLPMVFTETGFAFLALPLLSKVFKSPFRKGYPFTDRIKGQGVQKGVKIGVTVSRINPLTYSYSKQYQTKAGFNIGLLLTLPMHHFFVFQPEVHIVQKGYKSNADVLQKGIRKLTYLEIPVLFKSMLPLKGRFRPNVLLGVSPAIIINDKTDIISDPLRDIEKFDPGLYYGLELNWDLPKGTLLIEVTNVEGLLKINNNDFTGKLKNRAASVLVGYSF